MTTASSGSEVERQAHALLDLIEADRARQTQAILDAARGEAAALRAQAQAQARARLRQAWAEQRRLLNERVAGAQARLATQRRLHAQQHSAALLQLAREQLPRALQARWQQAATRAAWVAQVVAAARTHLPRGAWRVLHPDGWPATEQQALARQLAGAEVTLQFAPDPAIAAGLKIAAGGNVIDGTLAGLLADRVALEARLLRLLEQQA